MGMAMSTEWATLKSALKGNMENKKVYSSSKEVMVLLQIRTRYREYEDECPSVVIELE